METIDQPCVSISGLAVLSPDGGPEGPRGSSLEHDRVLVIGSTATEAHLVLEIRPDDGGAGPETLPPPQHGHRSR